MKNYSLLICALALFVASCSDDAQKSNSAEPIAGTDTPSVVATKGMKPLKLVLPDYEKPGTPTPIVLPNLDRRTSGFNPEIMIPNDATNIAFQKTVTSSDDFPLSGELTQITDGAKGAMEYVELPGGLQWIQIDLEKQSEIYAVAVWHRHDEYLAYKDVIIQISDDPEFKTGVATLLNNDDDNSAGLGVGKDMTWEPSFFGRLIAASGSKARYVRLYSDGNTKNETNAYCEVEVYGR